MTPTEPTPGSTIDQRGQTTHGPQTNIEGGVHTGGAPVYTGSVTIQQPPPSRIPQQRPARADHFVDRQEALTQLLTALHPGQVVTLCGPGGIGKTALAAEALWQLPADRFPAGIITHSFYGRGQIDLACEHIARTLGEELKPNPRSAAQRALAGRQLLLFLDGAEEADDLPTLLALRGGGGVLVTSRRRSDALAERQDVDPLPLTDAIVLLQAWGGPRANDPVVAGAIAELVGRLPLALRLIGHYLNEFEENAADYLTWLQETPLTALDESQTREQSILLLLDHNLTQVSKTAQVALSVIGIMALAPFTVTAVATALDLPERTTRHTLGELVNYGLLLRPEEHYVVSHTLIHTHACERLAPTDTVIKRLATHYTSVITAHPADFALLNILRPHVIALHGVCTTRHIWAPVCDLAWAIHSYLDLQGYWADRLTTINVALTAAQAQHDRYEESGWWNNWGNAYADLGKVEQAIAHYQQALTISREIGDRQGEGATLGNLGNAYADLGKVEQAIAHYQQALTISREIGDRQGEGVSLGNLGNIYRDLGQMEQAIEYYQQALTISREIGDLRGEGSRLGNLATAYYSLNQVDDAITHYQRALTISREIGDRRNEGSWQGNLGNVYAGLGQMAQAIEYYQQALIISQEIRDRRSESHQLGNLGLAYDAQGQVDAAITHYQQALTISREIGDRRNEGTWLANLGKAYAGLGQMEHAIVHFQQALAISQQIGDRPNEGNHLANLGLAYQIHGDLLRARQHWTAALAIYEELYSPDAAHMRTLLANSATDGL